MRKWTKEFEEKSRALSGVEICIRRINLQGELAFE